MKYYPDKWCLLSFEIDGKTQYKIAGSWYGRYTTGDSWRVNSGVKSIKNNLDNRTMEIEGFSGSIYVCPIDNYGCSMYTAAVLGSHEAFTRIDDREEALRILSNKENFK